VGSAGNIIVRTIQSWWCHRIGECMPYTAEISRSDPACIVLLVDQSGSMAGQIGGQAAQSKAESVARSINQLLAELAIRCTKETGVRNYFHVAVIGYGQSVGTALGGVLAGGKLVGISEIADNPSRIDQFVVKVEQSGRFIDVPRTAPVWLEPVSKGPTPMIEALEVAHGIVEHWIEEHPAGFPPIVLNLTDGESTDGEPINAAAALRALASSDGAALLLNLHVSSNSAKPVTFPDTDISLPDAYSRMLFEMSSVLPPIMRTEAEMSGYTVSEMTRGFVYNAKVQSLVEFLNIGTRTIDFR
jgi:hypothetical protein